MTLREWRLPAALILLGLIPIIAGATRLTELSTGPAVTPANARFVADPLPVVLHIVGAVVYTILGAFQFVPSLRRRRWHRLAGRVLVPSGLAVALSGLWMTFAYDLPAHDNDVLAGMRLVLGSAMAVSILLGLAAVLRRDFSRHRAWMVRGYAIGLGAGTQAFTHAPYLLATGEQPDGNVRALLVLAGWLINLAVAEWFLRRGARAARSRPVRRPRTAVDDTPSRVTEHTAHRQGHGAPVADAGGAGDLAAHNLADAAQVGPATTADRTRRRRPASGRRT